MSTGSKYNSEFIYQGSELKSALDIKPLYNKYSFKKWYYDNIDGSDNSNIDGDSNIDGSGDSNSNSRGNSNIIEQVFGLKRINSLEEIQSDKIYTKYDYVTNKMAQIYKDEIKNEIKNEIKSDMKKGIQNLIEEYKMPYLINGKLVCIRYNVVIYVSNVIRVFLFDKYHSISTDLPFSIDDLNTKEKIVVSYKNVVKITNKKILEMISNDNITILIISFVKLLLQYDVKPYPESNSGFYEFTIDIKFIENNLIPIIHRMNVWAPNRDDIEKSYIDEYYKWLHNCVILPHFGLSTHKSYI